MQSPRLEVSSSRFMFGSQYIVGQSERWNFAAAECLWFFHNESQ